jgi:glycosyltransferase involved in cell wall biosynthesis
MNRPKVSVCITTYNHEKFIAEALDSVLMQETSFDYEIVLGEDGSQDRTREICTAYAESHPERIRLFLRSREDVFFINGRATGRFNFVEGLTAAHGEYIALLEGDDYWTAPDKVQKQADLLDSERKLALCFHRVLRRHESSGTETTFPTLQPARDRFSVRDLLRRNFIPTCSVMFRNGLIGELPSWFFTAPSADWPLHILNAHHGDVGYIDTVMAVYRLHSGGVWSVGSSAEKKRRAIQTLETLRHNIDPCYGRELASSLAHWRIRLIYSVAQEEGLWTAARGAPSLLLARDVHKSTILREGLRLLWAKAIGTMER